MSTFESTIKETVQAFLRGSKIIQRGEKEDMVYAVAVMQRENPSNMLDESIQDSIGEVKENLEKARQGDANALRKAEEAYKKTFSYNKEKELLENIMTNSSRTFKELEDEIVKLKERM